MMNEQDRAWLETPDPGWSAAELAFLAIEDTFVSGDRSDHRLNVRYYRRNTDGSFAGKVFFGPGTQGPPDHAHGGSMAALMDEAMGGAAWLSGHPVLAAQLNVTFLTMLPLGTRCLVVAEVVAVDGRKVKTRGRLHDVDDARTYCEGEALFITLSESRITRLSDKAKGIVEQMKRSDRNGSA